MRYETGVVVNRPIEEVWAFLSDPFNAPRLRSVLLGVRTSAGPRGLGSTFQSRVVILGVERQISGAVTEWNPPHCVTFSVSGAGIGSGFLRFILEATEEGTKIIAVTEFEPRRAFKPLWWIAGPFLSRRWYAATWNIKRLLEAG